MVATKITTHRADALARLTTQYKGQPRFEGFIDAISEQIQDLEDASFDYNADVLGIATAAGEQLDIIGVIVDTARNSLSDADYRLQLIIKIGKNTSQGGAEKLISTFKLLVDTAWVRYVNLSHGEVVITGTDTIGTQALVNTIITNLEDILAGGVRIAGIICADEFESFAYEDSNALVQGLGYANDAGTLNGVYAEIYRLELPFAYALESGIDAETAGYGAGIEDPLLGGVYES
jgi:hypothetical protein